MTRKTPSRMTMTATKCSSPSPHALRPFGFSLIELLVVIVVIMILVGIGVAVGLKVMGTGQEKDTAATQELLINAIMTYHEVNPDYDGNPANDPEWPAEDDDHSLTKTTTTNALAVALANNPTTQPMLMDLPDAAFVILDKDAGKVLAARFCDAWGTPMLYTTAGVGNQPALISAGPDEKFGGKVKKAVDNDTTWWDTNDNADSEDNIRSDAGM